MKSVGEAMAIGPHLRQAFAKALRSRELDVGRTSRRPPTSYSPP
jgi:carbamoylphosphate synthase large subunit